MPARLCPCTQHGTVTPTQLGGLEPTQLLRSLPSQLLLGKGTPPATGPPLWPACDRVPWTHPALEQVEGELEVPRKLCRVLRAPWGQPCLLARAPRCSACASTCPARSAQRAGTAQRDPAASPGCPQGWHCQAGCALPSPLPQLCCQSGHSHSLRAPSSFCHSISLCLAGFPSLSFYLVSFPSAACFPCFPLLHPAAQPCPAEVVHSLCLLSLGRAVCSALPSPCLQHFRHHGIIFLFPLVL